MEKIAVVGAGFSGAVIAHELACAGYKVQVFDNRSHVAGNCHTNLDQTSNVMIHTYGPHIFHTNNEVIWNYINKFDKFRPFVNRVKAVANGQIYSLPVNLHTINSFYGKTFSPSEAKNFIEGIAEHSISEPVSFEDQALKYIGRALYEAFFKGYTSKQWGVSPKTLPASILKRLPIRFNYDDNYYNSEFQGIPENGYTYIVEQMLNHENIDLNLNTNFSRSNSKSFVHTFYSGPLDGWFGHSVGRLSYRTLDFLAERHEGDYQGNAVINYCDESVPWTRVTEHKHLTPWSDSRGTVIYKEYSRNCDPGDIEYYPLRLVKDKDILSNYVALAEQEEYVTFVGRLGTYRYIDMHITIEEALNTVKLFLRCKKESLRMPQFATRPV
jgi:UDP-galactopyranose mutase